MPGDHDRKQMRSSTCRARRRPSGHRLSDWRSPRPAPIQTTVLRRVMVSSTRRDAAERRALRLASDGGDPRRVDIGLDLPRLGEIPSARSPLAGAGALSAVVGRTCRKMPLGAENTKRRGLGHTEAAACRRFRARNPTRYPISPDNVPAAPARARSQRAVGRPGAVWRR